MDIRDLSEWYKKAQIREVDDEMERIHILRVAGASQEDAERHWWILKLKKRQLEIGG